MPASKALLDAATGPFVGKDKLNDLHAFVPYAGDPNGNVTPAHIGQWCFDTVDLEFYVAISTADTGWSAVSAFDVPVAEARADDPSQKMTLFDDFLGDLDTNKWEGADGTDTQAIGPTAVAGALNGKMLLTSGDVGDGSTPGDTTALVDGASINGKLLNWKANQGGLVMEAKLSIATVAESILFVGFIDEVSVDADVNLCIQASGTLDVIKSEVTNGCGLIYDTSFQTNPTKFQMGGTKAGVTTTVVGATGPSDGVEFTVRVEVSITGTLEVLIDGVSIGTIENAVTITTPLTPDITVASNDTNESLVTVDYIWVQQDR